MSLHANGFVDLHSHALPGLDDGPADPLAAVELVRGLEALGFADLYPTPHQKHGAWAPSAAQRDAAGADLTRLLAKAGARIRIHAAGGENMWDELFLARRQELSFPCYPGERTFLIELPPGVVPPRLEDQLFRLRVDGRLPVLAHVERYGLDRRRLARLARGAALLVNLPAVGGSEGFSAGRVARRLVRDGVAHAVATDSHGPQDLPACRTGLSWIAKHLGETGLRRLLREHPLQILAGELPESA